MGELLRALYDLTGNSILALEMIVIGAYAIAATLEAGYSRLSGRKLYHAGETALNLTMYTGFFLINVAYAYFIFVAYSFMYSHRLLDWGPGGWQVATAGLWVWLLLMVCDDFVFYWFHRASHRVRLLWASHITHHTSQYMNLSAAFRQTWTPFVALPFWLVLPWLGFDPLMVMSVTLINLFIQTAFHTQVVPKLGPIEWIFNTPSHHRVHHGANAPYTDRNFGGVLIIWDRLFGTFQVEQEKNPVRYGLSENIRGLNPLTHAFGEFGNWLRDLSRARSLREVLGYSFLPPGWRPLGKG
jgi:sterol desaturase/sphingolipid hydroxylase (fatty acid hydroxylase superfamily)